MVVMLRQECRRVAAVHTLIDLPDTLSRRWCRRGGQRRQRHQRCTRSSPAHHTCLYTRLHKCLHTCLRTCLYACLYRCIRAGAAGVGRRCHKRLSGGAGLAIRIDTRSFRALAPFALQKRSQGKWGRTKQRTNLPWSTAMEKGQKDGQWEKARAATHRLCMLDNAERSAEAREQVAGDSPARL